MNQNSQNTVSINNSRTTGHTQIFELFFEFLGQFTIRFIYHFVQKGVDNFETEHKTY